MTNNVNSSRELIDLTYSYEESIDSPHPSYQQYKHINDVIENINTLRSHVYDLFNAHPISDILNITHSDVPSTPYHSNSNGVKLERVDNNNTVINGNTGNTANKLQQLQNQFIDILDTYNSLSHSVNERVNSCTIDKVQQFDVFSVKYDTRQHKHIQSSDIVKEHDTAELTQTSDSKPTIPIPATNYIDDIITAVQQYCDMTYDTSSKVQIEKLFDSNGNITGLRITFSSVWHCIIQLQYINNTYQPCNVYIGSSNEEIDTHTFQSNSIVYRMIQQQLLVRLHTENITLHDYMLYICSYRNILTDPCDYCDNVLHNEQDSELNTQIQLPCIVHTYNQPIHVYHPYCYAALQFIKHNNT